MRNIHPIIKKTVFISAFLYSEASALQLPKKAQDIINRSRISHQNISVYIASADGESTLVDYNSDVMRKPASVAKIITTGIGLLVLGEDYRWRTEFSTNGNVSNNILNGDLFIKAYGNPYFVEEEMREAVLGLNAVGFSSISGEVILDDSYFARSNTDPDAFDGAGTHSYNALPHALNINFQTIKISFRPVGNNIQISTIPQLTNLKIDNRIRLNALSCKGKGYNPRLTLDRNEQRLVIEGSMSKKCGERKISRVIADPGDLLFAHFKKAWQQIGGNLSNDWKYGSQENSNNMLYITKSKPLYEQISAMNKLSNNVMTRQLFLTIGAVDSSPPATLNKSRKTVNQYLQKLGVNTTNMFIDNGSGLSRKSSLSARQIGQFLQGMHSTNSRSAFEQSLSIAGVDGTLRKRLRGTPLQGNAIGKTGTLENVKTVAGYLTSQSGKKYVYVILLEGPKAKTGRRMMDEAMKWLYYSG